jgi:uncharacterized protein YbaP (TraB family)
MTQLRRLSLVCVLLAAWVLPALAAGEPLFLWQVKSETATVTMVGSIHVGKPDFFPLPAPFEDTFADADVLAVEVDMGSPESVQKAGLLMMQKGMLPAGETLESRLDPELWAALQKYAEETGKPLAMYHKMHPALVMTVFMMEEMKAQGFREDLGIDLHFLAEARDAGKQIVELETVEDQMRVLLDVDDELDDILVAQFLEEIQDVQGFIDDMVALWQAGDVDGLDRFLQDQMGDHPAMQKYYRGLLDDRNVKMAEKIETMLAGDQDVYVVVGAGHFSGRMGVLQLLRDKGWDVVQGDTEMFVGAPSPPELR